MNPETNTMTTQIFDIHITPQGYYIAHSAGLHYLSSDLSTTQHRIHSADYSGLPVTAICVTDSIMIAAQLGQILRSFDFGTTCETIALPAPAPFITSLQASPNFEADQTIFATTLADGVIVSQDAGATWRGLNYGLHDWEVYTLAIDHNLIVYVGTSSGLYRSSNRGQHWEYVKVAEYPVCVLSLAISENGIVYAGTENHGLFVSDESGTSWQTQSTWHSSPINNLYLGENHIFALWSEELHISHDDGLSYGPFTPQIEKTIATMALHHDEKHLTVVLAHDDASLSIYSDQQLHTISFLSESEKQHG